MGVRLAVGDLTLRYRQPAHYDDLVRVRCWVRDLASRRIVFGYAVERDGTLLATATTAMFSLGLDQKPTRLPTTVTELLQAVPDPVQL